MFIPHKWHKTPEPWEGLPAAASIALEAGLALALSGGSLTKATGTTKPQYICMESGRTTKAGDMVLVERVRPETVYESTLSVASASIAIGAKYTIDTTGGKVTATDTGGVAAVVAFEGTAAGAKVLVRFE